MRNVHTINRIRAASFEIKKVDSIFEIFPRNSIFLSGRYYRLALIIKFNVVSQFDESIDSSATNAAMHEIFSNDII